jgi:hypothetical protein
MNKVIVTHRALMARINRHLATDLRVLKTARAGAPREALGDFYVVDLGQNEVVHSNVNPESFGRELGVLRAWEKVQQ